MKKNKIKINNLAKELNVSIQTIKNYETWGILPKARRDEKKWRYYTQEDVLKIKALFAEEIRQDLNKHKKRYQ
jgi:DNA-binding transcriptional MerR regulator